MIFKTKHNFGEFDLTHELNNQPSMTIPDQTMSMRTILDRYARGLPIGGTREGIFDDETETTRGINPKTLDLTDIQRLKEINVEQMEEVKRGQNERVQKRQEEKKAKELEILKQQIKDGLTP